MNYVTDSRTTKAQAEAKGKAALKLMKTRGWKLEIWENLGWHWCLVNGYMRIYPSVFHNQFSILMSEELNGCGGSSHWLVEERFADPNDAVTAQIAAADGYRHRVNEIVNTVLSKMEAKLRGRRSSKKATQ